MQTTRGEEIKKVSNLEKRAINLSLRLYNLNTDFSTILKARDPHSKELALKENRIIFANTLLRRAKKGSGQATQSHEVNRFVEEIQKEVLALLEDLEKYLKGNSLFKIDNPHINYFLTMAARYNGYFLEISQPTTSSMQKLHPLHALNIPAAAPFSNPILGNANNIKISYSKDVNRGRFRHPIIQADRGRQRFYYNEKESGIDFLDRYLAANKIIGFDTITSNIVGFFSPSNLSQGRNNFMRPSDATAHEQESKLFENAKNKIKNGITLEVAERDILERGKYYRGHTPLPFSLKSDIDSKHHLPTIFNIGHASELLNMDGISVGIDLVNYDCMHKDSPAYPRHTKPGISTSEYPLLHVVCYTHNHYDHLDENTIKEAMAGMNPLIVVPKGDAHILKKLGFSTIIEFESWNDSVTVALEDSVITIHALPAKHASNREKSLKMPDINTSLYMGFMLHQQGASHLTLVTGDTAVLDEEHHQQLSDFLFNHNLTVSQACIAAGPDRPRKYLECTHQSSADALTFHARLTEMNARVLAKRRGSDVTLSDKEILSQAACIGIGYHQGCFRLGVLNYNDVDSTITRTLATLMHYKEDQDKKLPDILQDLKKQYEILKKLKNGEKTAEKEKGNLTNYNFAMMDDFERLALINTLSVYTNFIPNAKAEDIINYICQHTVIPTPGMLINANNPESLSLFEYDYQRLIVNRDPTSTVTRAYENYIKTLVEISKTNAHISHLIESIAPDSTFNYKQFIEVILTIYRNNISRKQSSSRQKVIVGNFLNSKDFKKANNDVATLKSLLLELRGNCVKWQTADDMQRNEGYLETALILLIGLMEDPNFRKHFKVDYYLQFDAKQTKGPSTSS